MLVTSKGNKIISRKNIELGKIFPLKNTRIRYF